MLRGFVDDLLGDVYEAALSPRGDRVALTWCRHLGPNYSCGVYLRAIAGGEPKLIFADEELAGSLRWSPDEKWLSYTGFPSHNSARLVVRSLAGGEAKPVATICSGGYSWTADSQGFIVSASKELEYTVKGCGLWSYSREGKEIALIAAKGHAPAVSPDGRTLAFVRDHSIIVRSIADSYRSTGQERSVATSDTNFTGPVWIDGGKELMYATRGHNPLHRVSMNAGTKPRIVPGIDDQTEILSLDSGAFGSIVAEVNRNDGAFWQMNLKAQKPHFEKLQAVPLTDANHWVSPDGSRVVYVSNGALWTANLNGLKPRLLTRHREFITNPRWSPDGRSIAFAGWPDEGNADLRSRLYVVSITGGAPRRLLPGIDNVRFSNWSRDGKWLYVSRNNHDSQSSAKAQIWRANASRGLLDQVTKNGGFAGEESSNGDSLYYTTSPDPKLHRVPVSGGTESELPLTSLGSSFGGAFAVGRGSIFFVQYVRSDGKPRVLRYDLVSRAVEAVITTEFEPLTLQLSADERNLFATSNPPAKKSHVIIEGLR